jgi:hypothetical protein
MGPSAGPKYIDLKRMGDVLTPRRIYQVLPDESAARSHYVRVIDSEGEDYLYPADYFIFMEFPHEVTQALLQTS